MLIPKYSVGEELVSIPIVHSQSNTHYNVKQLSVVLCIGVVKATSTKFVNWSKIVANTEET